MPVTKYHKEDSLDSYKYRNISLVNIGDKVLEKFLIKKIMYHIYIFGYLNDNEFGFTCQKSTTDANMAMKQFIETDWKKVE